MNHRDMQNLVRQYRRETGKIEVDMHEVAAWAIEKHLYVPKPISPVDRLAQDLARAAREETRVDAVTGIPYRVNQSFTQEQGSKQQVFWVDIDQAHRSQMHRSVVLRRNQMVADGYSLSADVDHWNRINPKEQPIQLELDLSADIAERKAAMLPPDEAA